MLARRRSAFAVLLTLATSATATAQTLTVNKDQQTLAGVALNSSNAGVGVLMKYVITITSSDTSKPQGVTITDKLPAGFVLLATPGTPAGVSCTPSGSAVCPTIPSNPATLSPPPLVLAGGKIPASAADVITITIVGYFSAPGTYMNHVEAQRVGETTVEPTAMHDTTLTLPSTAHPVALTLTKSVSPTSGSTGTNAGSGTTYHYTIKVANNSATDIYLGGSSLTDVIKSLSGTAVGYKFSNFSCTDPACPTQPTGTLSGPVGFGSGTQAFQLPWSPGSVVKAGSSFVLTFDAAFDVNTACGSGQSTIENDAILAVGGSLTSIAAAVQLSSSFALPACQQQATLTLLKTQVSPANPVAWGALITYKISFTNNTGAALTNLSVTDSLSPAATAPLFTATVPVAPVCAPACTFTTTFPTTVPVTGFTNLFTAKFASIPNGAPVTITFQVKFSIPPCATGGAGTTIDNWAQSSPVQGATLVTTNMQPLPDCGLKVTKSLTTANPVVLGQPVEFQITYTNPFPQAVTVRTLEDVASLSSAAYGDLPIQITASSCQATGSVTPLPTPIAVGTNTTIKFHTPAWSGPPLLNFAPVTFGPGASLSCTIRFVPQQPTLCQGAGTPQIVNWAFIDTGIVNTSSPQPPPVSAPATADLPLCRTIGVNKVAPKPQSFTPGTTVTYTVQVTNNNPNDPVTGIHLDDPLPPGFVVTGASCASPCVATFSNNPPDAQAAIPVIAAGGTVVVTITVTAPATGGSYDNVATASFDQQGSFFPGPGNSLSSTANVQVLTPRLTKSFTPAGQGNQATMTLTLTNVGGNPLELGIKFTDTLSPGLQIVGTPSTTCHVGTVTVAGNAITFQGQLQAGEATCTVTVLVQGAGCNDRSNISNTANIDPSGVKAVLNVQECPLSLTVQKAVTGAPSGFTGTFHFTVVCTTSSGLIQQQLTITWPSTTATLPGIPPGATCFVSEDPTLPPLPAGSSWSGVPISNPPGGVIVLTAGGTNQVSFTNAIRTCNDSARLKITKVLNGVPPGFSGTFDFTVTCWSGTNLVTRQVQITLPGPATVTVPGLPPGASCTVSEVSPEPALPAGWFWQAPSYVPATGQVNLVGNCCPEVVVTDTAKFCCDSGAPIYRDVPPNPSHGTPSGAVPPP